MKNYEIRIQPFSALAGACLVVLCLVATGAFAPQGSSTQRDVNRFIIEPDYHPSEIIRIDEGVVYTIPTGKYFVPIEFGDGTSLPITNNYDKRLFVNGTQAMVNRHSITEAVPAAVRCLLVPGATVQTSDSGLNSGSANVKLVGYLIDA
jgi:hypothetical protein